MTNKTVSDTISIPESQKKMQGQGYAVSRRNSSNEWHLSGSPYVAHFY